MIKKHPPRSDKDNMDINGLRPSIYAPDISEDIVYSTAMKPSKRGVAPGPNGDRAEFMQSALYNPFSSSLSATVLHFLTKHINLERNGLLPEEWYQISTFSTLIAQGPFWHGVQWEETCLGSLSQGFSQRDYYQLGSISA